jgi:hypothetical protein
MSRTISLLIIACSTMIMAAGASAASIELDIETTAFAPPAMHFEYVDGAFVWDRKPVIAVFTAKGSVEHGFEWAADAFLVPDGLGGQPLDWRMPAARDWAHSGSIILSRAFLASYAARFASLCARDAGADEAVTTGVNATFIFTRSYLPEGDAERDNAKPSGQAMTTVTLPMTISCAARRGEAMGMAGAPGSSRASPL